MGLGWLATLPMDVILMDLQYTTAIVTIKADPPRTVPGRRPISR